MKAAQATNKGEETARPQVRPDKLIEYFDSLLNSYLGQGVDLFRFEQNAALQVGRGGRMQVLERVVLPAQAVDAFIRHIVSLNAGKAWEDVDDADIRLAASDRQVYDIELDGGRGPVARSFSARILQGEQLLAVELTLDPLFLLGYERPSDPASLDDQALADWLDDFGTRLMARKNPRPKDVVLSPNKENPYVTVTGGLKPIEDVHLRGGGTITGRIAAVMIRQANNPIVNERIQKNGGRLQGLDLDLAFKTRVGRRFRVNVADSFDNDNDHGPLITMRLLPEKPWTTSDLPLPKVVLDTVMNTRMGLVLISGTTGSGKSTTMGVLIDYLLRKKSVNFLTIESPIETMFPSRQYPRSIISQRELGKHTATLHRGLESAVRQTLNMAMVGEIRNAQDAAMALELAQSGHLIFATIHSGSVGESVRRLVDMFPADQEGKIREMLAAQYKLGLAQILVKGTQGQTELVMEVMRPSSDIKRYILDQQEEDSRLSMRELLERLSSRLGTCSLDQSLVALLKAGKISEDTLMYNSPDPDALIHRQTQLGIKLSSRWDAMGAQILQDTAQKLSMALVYDP